MGAPAPRRAALRSIEFFENLTRGPPLNRVGIIGLRPAVLVVALDPVLSLGWTDTEGGISGCSPRVHGDHDLESELDGDVVVWVEALPAIGGVPALRVSARRRVISPQSRGARRRSCEADCVLFVPHALPNAGFVARIPDSQSQVKNTGIARKILLWA